MHPDHICKPFPIATFRFGDLVQVEYRHPVCGRMPAKVDIPKWHQGVVKEIR